MGITLIMLVITAVIITVLSAATVAILWDTDIFESARVAVAEWQVKDIKERVEDTYVTMISENFGNPREVTVNDVVQRLVNEGIPVDVLR